MCDEFACASQPTSVAWGAAATGGGRVVAVGQVDGAVQLCAVDVSANDHLSLLPLFTRRHKAAVRRLRFAGDLGLFSMTSNRALCQWDVGSGRKVRCVRAAHDAPPYALCSFERTARGQSVATADEAGVVRTWDFRAADPLVFEFGEQSECISDLSVARPATLLATSVDGTMSAYSLRKGRLLVHSEMMHAELLSVCVARTGRVYCGAGDGYIEVFNRGEYGNIIDRIKSGHRGTVDSIAYVRSHNVLISASTTDETVRLTSLRPPTSLGVVCRHADGVEEVAVSEEGDWLASIGHDDALRFCRLDSFVTTEIKAKAKRALEEPSAKRSFFADL